LACACSTAETDFVVAVVDPEDHVPLAHQSVVAGEDRRDMARHARAENRVVGADIGIVGGNIEASDQRVIDAVAATCQREQRDNAHQHLSALAGFPRGGRHCHHGIRGPGGFDRRFVGGRRGWRLRGPTPGFFGEVRAKLLGNRSRSLAVRLGLALPRFGPKKARGLVSRCGHMASPLQSRRDTRQPTGPTAY